MCETIFSNFLGAFFGFLFAILIEVIVNKVSDSDMQRKVKTSLVDELSEIKKALESIKHNDKNPVYFRYQYAAWQTCVNSGFLFSVSGQPIYNMFIKIYTDIEFADNLERRYFELLTISEKNEVVEKAINYLDVERKRRRDKILYEIEEVLKI